MKICPVINYNSEKVYDAYFKPAINPSFCGRKLLTEPIIDKCSFSHSDKSLSPSFLKSLLEISDKDPVQMVQKIKNKILKAMGYKHPELMCVVSDYNVAATYDTYSGDLFINPEMVQTRDKEDLIGIIRHELEHMDQEMKLFKTIGEDAYLNLIIIKNIDDPDFFLYNVSDLVNLNFYRQMSKDADISNFDLEKFYKAEVEYGYNTNTFSGMYKYLTNPIEKEAYDVQRRVLAVYGLDRALAPDTFPKNYKKVVSLMNKLNIPKKKQFSTYNFILNMHIMREYLSKDDIAAILPVLSKVEQHQPVTEQDKRIYIDIINKIEKISNELTPKQYGNMLKNTEESLRQGKYTADDIFGAV